MYSANIESDLTVMVTELLPSKGIQKHSCAFLKYQLSASLCLIQNSQFKGTLNSKYNILLSKVIFNWLLFLQIYKALKFETLVEISLDTNMLMTKTPIIFAPPDSHRLFYLHLQILSNGRYFRNTRNYNQVSRHETAWTRTENQVEGK